MTTSFGFWPGFDDCCAFDSVPPAANTNVDAKATAGADANNLRICMAPLPP
jgi:hypothetical protein